MLCVTSRPASPHRPRRVARARARATSARRRVRVTPMGLLRRVLSVDTPLAPPRRVSHPVPSRQKVQTRHFCAFSLLGNKLEIPPDLPEIRGAVRRAKREVAQWSNTRRVLRGGRFRGRTGSAFRGVALLDARRRRSARGRAHLVRPGRDRTHGAARTSARGTPATETRADRVEGR